MLEIRTRNGAISAGRGAANGGVKWRRTSTLNPGNAGTGSSGRQSLGLRKPVQVTVYKFVGMMWNICLEEKIRVDQLRGDIL